MVLWISLAPHRLQFVLLFFRSIPPNMISSSYSLPSSLLLLPQYQKKYSSHPLLAVLENHAKMGGKKARTRGWLTQPRLTTAAPRYSDGTWSGGSARLAISHAPSQPRYPPNRQSKHNSHNKRGIFCLARSATNRDGQSRITKRSRLA